MKRKGRKNREEGGIDSKALILNGILGNRGET